MTQMIVNGVALIFLLVITIMVTRIWLSVDRTEDAVREMNNKRHGLWNFGTVGYKRDEDRWTHKIDRLRNEMLRYLSDEMMLGKTFKYRGQTYKVVGIDTSADEKSIATMIISLDAVNYINLGDKDD